MYKIYAGVLAERLRKEAEKKGILIDSQRGFRKGMKTMDQIYILYYLINRRIRKDKI